MLAARRCPTVTMVSLLLCSSGCGSTRTPVPAEPTEEPARAEVDGAGARAMITQPRDAGAAAYDEVIADMVGECGPVIESNGSTELPRVSDRRVDLDGDGQDEAIVNVSCEDVSIWRVLTRRGDEAIAMLEKLATDTSFEVMRGPDGRALLVSEHDCCCMYELDVHAMRGEALETLFSWHSGCAQGCATGAGYRAEVTADAEARLMSIELPSGECGAKGSESVDLVAWTAKP